MFTVVLVYSATKENLKTEEIPVELTWVSYLPQSVIVQLINNNLQLCGTIHPLP